MSNPGRSVLVVLVMGVMFALAPGAALAADTVIGFDDQPSGTVLSTQYASLGVTFDQSPSGAAGYHPTVQSDPTDAHSTPNVLNIQAHGGEVSQALMWARFAAPRNHVSAYIGDASGSSYPAQVTMQGYDLAGNAITGATDTVSFSSAGVDNPIGITDPQSAISYVEIVSQIPDYGPIAIDDFSFDAVPSAIPPDFALSAASSNVRLAPGASFTQTLTLHRNSTSSGPISLSVSGLPSNIGVSLSPNPATGGDGSTITLTLSAPADSPPESANVTVTGTPSASAGTQPRSVTFGLNVAGPYELRVQGIQVTQGVQYPVGVLVPSGSDSGGNYTGVDLVVRKQTAARVYVDAIGALAPGISNVDVTLSGFRNGQPMIGSPLHPDYGPSTVTDVGEADPAPVFSPELLSDANAYTFTLPTSWASGTVQLVANATPLPTFNPSQLECSSSACQAARTFTLNDVTFRPTQTFTLGTVALMNGTVGPVSSDRVFADTKLVTPLSAGNFLVTPYEGTIDASSILNAPSSAQIDVRSALRSLVDTWDSDNGHPFDATSGVVRTGSGSQTGGRTSVVDFNPDGSGDDRPLTAVAHETFHLFGLKHASVECGGGQDSDSDDTGQAGVPWPLKPGDNEDVLEATLEGNQATDTDPPPPDDGFGQLLGVGLNMSSEPYQILADGLGGVGEYYDFMSYCSPTRGFGDAGNWVSPINWENLVSRFAVTAGAADVSARTARARAASRAGIASVASVNSHELRILAYADTTGVHIEGVGPTVGPPVPTGGSPYTLTALGAHGQILRRIPMAITAGHVDFVGPLDELTAEVPAAGVDAIQVSLNGTVLASRTRPKLAPRVRLLAPHARAIVGGRRSVVIRWRASNPEHQLLTASIDYSRDNGRTWRTVFVGANRGRVSLPAFYFTRSRAARVRIRVNDGFNETSHVSARFTALGAPPQAAIQSTLPRLPGDAMLPLVGQAFDTQLRMLAGGHLQWYDGRVALGSGNAITAGPLPPGINRITLRARDSYGAVGSASVTVRVAAVNLPFLKLSIPRSIRSRTRVLTIRASSSIAATLTVGRRSLRLRSRPGQLRLSVRRGRVPILLELRVSAGGTITPFAALVGRR
jgi:hypothetical protein